MEGFGCKIPPLIAGGLFKACFYDAHYAIPRIWVGPVRNGGADSFANMRLRIRHNWRRIADRRRRYPLGVLDARTRVCRPLAEFEYGGCRDREACLPKTGPFVLRLPPAPRSEINTGSAVAKLPARYNSGQRGSSRATDRAI